jgi:TonB-linked SusC/RagA family outer membrane protein
MKKLRNFFWDGSHTILKKRMVVLQLAIMIILASTGNLYSANAAGLVDQQAVQKKISGTVTDATGKPMPGVTVSVKGMTIGSFTDEYGKYDLTVPETAQTLVFSFVGMKPQEIEIGTQNAINVVLKEESVGLEEVVVIGYGTSKAKDLTAPISTVKAEDLVKRTTASAMDAMQGSTAGVQIISTGEPGANPTVRIRGVGSLKNESPLYVVDGMFFDNIDFLNPNDIQDMSILKDASGAAIYGVRAANGVVLITTKRGKFNAKTTVTYNAYAGFQTPVNMLKMANGEQYATMELQKGTASDSAHVTSSVTKFGGTGLHPSTSTDWYDEILRKRAFTQSHSLELAGGSEKAAYSLGLNYLYQDGIMNSKNSYERYNIHGQTDFQAYSWLKVGYNFILTNYTTFTPNNTAFLNAYLSSPLYPVYDETNTSAFPDNYASSTSIGFANGAYANPVAAANYYYNRIKGFQILPNIYAEINLFKDKLKFRSQLSEKLSSLSTLNYTPAYYVDAYQLSTDQISHLKSIQERFTNYVLDNLLTYNDTFGDNHISMLVGQSTRDERWRALIGTADNVSGINDAYMYLDLSNSDNRTLDENGTDYRGLSYFARATYDFASKYLLTATIRADGSSKYQQKWGYFPSVGAGWVISQENFMKNQHLFDFMKLRASWGMLGNDGIDANNGFSSYTTGTGVSGIFNNYGSSSGQYVDGYVTQNFYRNLKWEVVQEWDLGLDFTMLKSKLSGTLDYYHRMTSQLAFSKPQPMGAPDIYGNWGKVLNQGIEITMNWRDKVGDLVYNIGANVTTLKNEVKDINGLAYIATGTSEFPTRIEVGKPVNYFYGYQVAGVYQNSTEVTNDAIGTANGVKPGYLKYKDQDGNNILDENDKVNLGSYLPKMTYGFNVSLEYHGFDMNLVLQGQAGNKILNMNRARRLWYSDMNGDKNFVTNLWTGDGSTNKYPSAYASTQGWNNQASSFFVENGSYMRIQNVQLGYNFNLGNIESPVKCRVYMTADRPVIFTKYNGFTPEIGGTGYDDNTYPSAATFSIGCRIIY